MADGNWRAPFAIGLVAGAVLAVLLFLVFPDQSLNWFSHNGTLINFTDTFANWLIAFFSVIAAALLWKTLRATQEMAEDTRRIGEAQVRAYLDIKLTSVEPKFLDKGVWIFRVNLRNSGQSPARQVYVHVKSGEAECIADTIFPDLGAGAEFEGGIHLFGVPKEIGIHAGKGPWKPFTAEITVRFLDVFYGANPERVERRDFSITRSGVDNDQFKVSFSGDHVAMFERMKKEPAFLDDER